jgi:hypothetical protein
MGGEPWQYFVPFNKDIDAALQELRIREFTAGRYHLPGKKPKTIDDVFNNMSEEGTRSILDMIKVSDSPEMCAVSPFTSEELTEILGTDKPTHKIVETKLFKIFNAISERGEGRYLVVYKDNKPDELLLSGYSFD